MRILSSIAVSILLTVPLEQASALPLSLFRERAEAIREGGFVLAPLAFLRFCKANREECPPSIGSRVVTLDDAAWRTMQRVNLAVNRWIKPQDDRGEDTWTLGARYGDCDDYAVEKRHRLLRAGFPASALSLTEVVANGSGHLILTVRTNKGDFILDNLRSRVVPLQEVGYKFVKLQSAKNPDYWVAVESTSRSLVVAEADSAEADR